MSSVQEALERRKKRNEAAVQKKSKVDTALEAYKKRKQASSQSAVSDITNRINSEIEAVKKVSSPSWGSGTLNKTLESTRESRLNIEKLQREVESYKGYLDEKTYNSLFSTVTGLRDSYSSFLSNAEVMEQFDSEDSYKKWYGEYSKRQEERKWVQSLDDFEANKGYVSTKKDDIWGKMTAQYGLNYGDLTYEYINNQNNLRDEIKSKYRAYSSDNMFAEEESDYEQKGYDFLTDEEISIYNYYYNRHGKERAQQYIDSLEDELVQRKAGKEFKAIEGNTLAEIFYGAYAGGQQFRQGLENVGSMITGDKGFTPSSQYVSGMAREDLADNGFKILGSSVGQVAYDFLNTSANMLPSILVGAVTGGVGGAATLGASAMGNGYAEMRKLGYTENQARGYGLLVGASEAVLSYALGGISKLGGGGNGVFQTIASKIVPKLDNAIARVAIELGGNMLDEGLEEAIQEVLDPIFKMAATGEDFEGIDLENVLYSGLLGMLTAGVMEGAPNVVNTVGSSIKANKIYGGNVGELVTESLEINPDNAHAQRMQERLDNGKSVSGYQINRLVEANESAMVSQDKAKMKSAAEARLTELGETGDIGKLSEVIVKAQTGGKLTKSEQTTLINSKYGRRVSTELNPKSIRSGEYSSAWAEKLDTNRINVEEYSKLVEASQIAQNSENKAEVQTVAEAPKVAETKAVEASEDVTEEAQPASKIEADVTDNRSVKESPSVQETESEEASTVSLEDVSKKYGAQSGAMINTYISGQDVSKYDAAYKIAYDMGMSGVSLDYVMSDESTEYLSKSQRQLAYEAGQAASNAKASEQDTLNKNAANGKTGRKRGVVKGDDVTIADLKKTFNDSQGKAYKILSTIADVTGVDIVLYKSEPNKQGEFEGAQGKFKWSEDTIYIDINAGIKGVKNVDKLAKYSMLRTFSHEFTHFLEKWNPLVYNEFRKVVFDELRARGQNVHELIDSKVKELVDYAEDIDDFSEEEKAKYEKAKNEAYDKASREVVAEAMTDILPDSSFAQELAENHKNIFEKLLEKLKEFVSNLKAYFNSLAKNPSREANALKEQIGDTVRYAENIVKMFDEMAIQAVENYQATVATEEKSVNTSETAENVINPEKIDSTVGIKAEENVKKVEKPSETPTQTAQETPTEVTPESEHFAITDNTEYGSIEIKFDEKPSEAVRDILKENKFRWNRNKGVWYGKADRGALTEALNKAYESEEGKPTDFETAFKNATQEERDEVVEAINENTKISHIAPTEIRETESTEERPAANVSEKFVTPSEKLADMLLDGYINAENINKGGKALTSKELYVLADEAFGGTQAEGTYDRKDAYDAMELAVNKFLLKEAERAHKSFNGTADSAVSTVEFLQDMLDLLPTQNVRTKEMEDFQQFSTPPNIAYLATWAANIKNTDFALEPSAGIGGLAVFAKAYGAEVAVNELSKRRLEVLRAMGFDHLFNENAEHIDNILPENISPSVVIMNPPFSSTAGRTANNKTSNAEKHIDQALARLRDGGRLVAILGKGMNNNDYYKYWDKLRKNYNIRANLSVDGSNYKKYGTTYDVQIVVIDKTGPQTGETVTGKYTDLTEIPYVLEDIRNDRRNVEENRVASSDNGIRESVPDGNNKQSDTGHSGIGERSDGSTSDTKPKKNRKGAETDSGAGNRAELEGSAKVGGQEIGSEDGRGNRDVGRTDIGDSNGAVESSISDRHQSELPLSQLNDTNETEEVSDDGVYATFVAPDIPIKGGKKHPAVLVESAAMAAVSMPKATYKVKLPADVINNNLSDAQLVTVTYAGQAHEQKLPDGRRKGFFIGDGTGVGKGRQIAGIILDNFMQGRDKAVWISKNDDLYGDAVRDWTATTGRSKDEVVSQGKFKPKDSITLNSGVLFTSYGKLKMEKGGNRLDQIVNWLGEDFDGVIAFDEAHFMGNLFGKKGKFGKSKGSLTAQAGVELQRRLPNARIVYVSATAATEVDNLAYAERIGLWGQGTAFTNAQDFISKIGASGLAAMELVIRDMKAMGVYVARSISYNGVNYDTVEHALDPMQTQIYNTMSRAWQKTMSNVQKALETTGGKYNSTERQKALGNFYSGMQRFYNQVLTSMSMPSVIADMRRELEAGHSCVLQIVNTNEAQQNKQLAEAKANGESLDNLDLTPREALVGYLMNSFPTQMFEEYTDDDGNLRSRPVMDSAGNPVQNKEAVRQRDALVAEVNQMSIPDGPLEMLFDAFGTEAVAENTGRSRRVVPKKMPDGSVTRVEESRSLNHRTADVQAFQDGKKRILVFSDAGGTGKSYHADRSEKNQQLRIHYVLQPGWVASNAVQGFGRTHRSNEANAPVYKLVTTNIKGQKRFTSTIARRLDQLGALTKGQRDTGSGMFGAKDNLETDLAKDSLREFYRRLGKNVIEDIDGMKILDRLGLKEKFTDEFGAFKINETVARDISTFLNRILALEVDEQNVVFDAFISIYEMELEAAIQSGTLDTGMENVKADKIEVVDEKVIRKDKNTGSETSYIQAKTYTKPKVVTTVAEMSKRRDGFVGFYKTESGAVRAVFRIADKTTEWGEVQKQFRLVGPNLGAKTSVWNETTLKSKAEAIDKAEWQKEWDSEVAKVPEYNEDTLHMLTGALLPIWNSLPQEGSTKVKRLVANDGSTYLGRVIDKELIDGVLNRFSVDRTKEVFTAQQVMDKAIKNGTRFYLTNNRVELFRSKVSGEWRLEISQPYNAWFLMKTYPGLIQERIQYRDRYFIPVGDKGTAILEKLLQDNPVRNTADDSEQYQSRAYLPDDEQTIIAADNAYISAVNRGDMETAQRMVDEAAKEAGYTVKAYHGTDNNFSVFNRNKIMSNTGKAFYGTGFYFSTSELDANNYGKKIMPVYLRVGKTLDLDGDSWTYDLGIEKKKDKVEIEKTHIEQAPRGFINLHYTTKDNPNVWKSISNISPSQLVADETGKTFLEKRLNPGPSVLPRDIKNLAELAENNGYSSIKGGGTNIGDVGTEYVLFDAENIKSAEPVTYDDNGNVIPLSQRFNADIDDVRYQQRTEALTDEEVLEMAAEELYSKGDLSDAERDALSIFQGRIGKLTELQSKRAEQGRLYKEQQFGEEVDREAAAETLSRMRILDSQIKKASEDVLSVENKAIFKSVLQKARKIVEEKQWEHDQEVLRRWRDRRKNAEAIKKYRDRLRKDVDELSNWVLHPNNKDIVKHIPDALKNSVIPFLSSINFISKRSLDGGKPTAGDKEFMKRLEGLQAALEKNIDVNGMYSGYNDLPPDFMDNLDMFIKSVKALADNNNGEFIINKMTSGEIKELSKVVKTLKKYIMQMNRFHNNAMFQHVYEAGDDSIDFMEKLNPAENTGKISNFVLWQQMRPAYAFERFGKGGMAIYDGLRRGQAKLAFNTKEIEAFATKAYTEAEVKAWEDDIKSFRLGGDNVKVPVSFIMGLYELSKDPDALKHIDGEGIRIATYTRKGKKISDRGHTLTRGELNQMIGTLTQRQKDVADSLQKYMAEQGGKWGNYVSVARFGEELFTNKNYYPINSDGRHLRAKNNKKDETPDAASLYALLNMSFTKSRNEDAKNRIVVYSIFDVFANHMASMAQYNAFALPILDAVKWLNYQQVVVDEHGNKTVVDSVRERMTRAFGVPEETRPGSGNSGYAEKFVENIIKAFNGTEAQGSPMDSFGLNPLRRYNMAQIAYNFRVVVQQPLAITRAALLLDYGSIVKGMRLKPAAIKKNIEEMQKYSGIAAWKSLGFYDVNISRGVTDIIKHESKFGDKVRNIGMWGAEKMDILTWAGMWSAAKEEVMLKQHLRPESDGFYEAVTKLFEDVIYKTQVVDSVLTKNEFMRDKGFFARAIGSFMSEPTTTASMLIDAYDKYQMDMQRGMSKQQAWNKNKDMIGRVALVYAVSQVMLAAVQSIPDAFRDDDDYQEWYEKWLEAFTGNLIDEFNLFNKLPIISDVYEAVEAIASPYLKEWFGIDVYTNPPQTLYMQWQDSLVNGWEIIVDKIKGADTNYTWYAGIFKLLQAASGAVGLPMAAATREVITAWNNTIGAMAPSLKVKTYDPGEKSEIKYAYLDGYLTSEEAIEQLISQELVDTKDEAYWTVQGWGKESYSKYDTIYSVVRNDGNINSAMAELTSHGLTEKVVLSAVKSKIGTWYKDGEITKQQAINKLEKYLDMDSDEITALVNKWSSKVVTGIDYDDIKNEYLSGNISASRAIDMRVLYGGETREKATQTVNEWKAFKDTGIEYGEIKEAFMDGDISATQAKQMYIEYGGKSAQEAAETVSVLEFVKEYPETEGISYAAVEDYTMYCEHLGVPATVFYDTWKYNNEISADVDANGKAISGSKKTKVLQYINSLRLTSAQKDSLYYAFGWAQSKINEAPWR